MNLKETKASLAAYLESKEDPEEIRIITDAMKAVDEAIADDEAKKTLIEKQSRELKEFFLHDTITRKDPIEENPPEPTPRKSVDDIIRETIQNRKEMKS